MVESVTAKPLSSATEVVSFVAFSVGAGLDCSDWEDCVPAEEAESLDAFEEDLDPLLAPLPSAAIATTMMTHTHHRLYQGFLLCCLFLSFPCAEICGCADFAVEATCSGVCSRLTGVAGGGLPLVRLIVCGHDWLILSFRPSDVLVIVGPSFCFFGDRVPTQ